MANGRLPVVLEMTLPVGAAPPLHLHGHYDDSSYLLAGQLLVQTGDEIEYAGPGHWMSVPRGVPHGFRVVGDQPARILVVNDAESFLELIVDVGEPTDELRLPVPSPGPGDADLKRILADHDTTVLGPSMTERFAQAFLATPR